MQTYNLKSKQPSPVSLTLAKQYLRVDASDDDEVIQNAIDSATTFAERYTSRDLRKKTWALTTSCFPESSDIGFVLHRNIVTAVTSIDYRSGGSLVTFPPSNYYLTQAPSWAYIDLVDGAEWPSSVDDRRDAVTITFDTNIDPRFVETVKDVLLKHVAHLYQNRGDCASSIPNNLLAMYDLMRIPRV